MYEKQVFVCSISFVSFAIVAEEAPIAGSGWYWDYPGVTFNGKLFTDVAESYREQDGYAIVEGLRFHYWLYDTISYHNGDADAIYNKYIPSWVEKMGYVIDFDNITVTYPNTELASSTKALMRQRDCDVSVALVTYNANYDYVVINEWFESKDTYKTTAYPFWKEVSEILQYLGYSSNTGIIDLGVVNSKEEAYQIEDKEIDFLWSRARPKYATGGIAGNQQPYVTDYINKHRQELQRGHLYKLWWLEYFNGKETAFVETFWVDYDGNTQNQLETPYASKK